MNGLAGSLESCLFLFVRYEELDNDLKEKTDVLLSKIKLAMESADNLEHSIEQSYNEIFRLRMMAFKSIIDDENDLIGLIQDSYSFFEDMIDDKKLSVLGENILYAIRSNAKIAGQIFAGDDINASISGNQYSIAKEEFYEMALQLQRIEFTTLINLIRVNVPNGLSSSIAEWLEVSLKMEFAILAGAMIKEQRIVTNSDKIDELAFILSDATHTYNAIAIEEGIIKKIGSPNKLAERESLTNDLESDFFQSQQKLADSDLKSFSENWE